jgi:predicted deacylase
VSGTVTRRAPTAPTILAAQPVALQLACDGSCRSSDDPEDPAAVQRAVLPGATSAAASDAQRAAIQTGVRGGGSPLDPASHGELGRRFGHDFSAVRIHRDGAAAASARSLGARAYTVGHDIVFGADAWAPHTIDGQRLLAHELTHVVQQVRAPRPSSAQAALPVSQPGDPAEQEADRVAAVVTGAAGGAPGIAPPIHAAPPSLARTALPVGVIDQAITDAVGPVPPMPGIGGAILGFLQNIGPQLIGHRQGEIAFAASYPGGAAPAKQPASPVPKADPAPVPIDTSAPLDAHFFPSGRYRSAERALILGGFHGDEHPGWELPEALVAELTTSKLPLFFHTIVVPRVNAGAIADELAGKKFWRNRCNRQVVDLNRNFPTGGTPKDTDCVNTAGAPLQPEVEGVINLIKTFKPDRILSTHAISTPSEAGVFADPNTDPAAVALARGMASTVVDAADRPFNRLTATTFNPVYPRDTPGKVSGGTSLGAYGPTATGGNIPVVTTEAPSFGPLAATGVRSIESLLRPVRAFLTDPALLDTKADEDILTDIDSLATADRIAFLTGKTPIVDKIFQRIRLRVDTAVAKLNALTPAPPNTVTVVSGLRLYDQRVPGPTGGSPQAEIIYNKFFLRSGEWDSLPTSFFKGGVRAKGVDKAKWLAEPSASRLAIILRFSALPGASRHHWDTEVDFNSTTTAEWEPAATASAAPGKFFKLGTWLQANAARVGFLQPYTSGRTVGYNEEQWHYSYAPLAIGLRKRYDAQVNLSTDVADAFLTDLKARAAKGGETVPLDLDAAVKALKISDFVDGIGPGL